jgi:redox-sensitive bicupin YhaK (pirin superfamily)
VEIEVRRADERFESAGEGTATRHSFSFGTHYDPLNLGFGLLVCHDEHELQPLKGYDEHPHRDLEIVTWMLEGELHHRDSSGHVGVVVPGEVQVLGAGAGVLHEEHAGAGTTRFVQMWVRPDETGLPPRYLQEPMETGDEWTVVPGVRSSRAALHATRLRQRGTTTLPVAPYVHLFVCRGQIALETGPVLNAGDAVRVTDAEGIALTGDAELLAWAMR